MTASPVRLGRRFIIPPLPSIIEYLLAEGYTIVPISEILLTGDTYIDHTGRQFPAETSE